MSDISCVNEFKIDKSRLLDLLCFWNSPFFLLIIFFFWISSFILGGSLLLHTMILFGIKLWKIFNVLLNTSTSSWTFLPENNFDQSKLSTGRLSLSQICCNPKFYKCKDEDIQFLIKFWVDCLIVTFWM